ICFPRAFGQVLDLLVLDADLLSQKDVFAFKARHVFDATLSWIVAPGRALSLLLLVTLFHGRDLSRLAPTSRDLSRHVGACRDRAHLLDVRNVLVDRCR